MRQPTWATIFGARPWTVEDAERRSEGLAAKATPKPSAQELRDKAIVGDLRQREAEITRLESLVAKKAREDAMAADLKAKQGEIDRLESEVARRDRRAKGFAGHVRIGGGFNPFGKHPQRPTRPAA
jgi:hypothetical protein